MYTMTLQDGRKLKKLELNGNNYIAEGVLEDSVFADNLASVIVTDGKITEKYTDMVLISNRVEDGRSWFVLGEKSAAEKGTELLESEIMSLQLALAEVYELILTGGV